ncbi:MAG: hydrolase 1, exosortase A system-associated [Rhodospirillales bacterium]|nr:MAG: hydrolase 1, exosortase A system-associated [Rhodospirillales bacterium]
MGRFLNERAIVFRCLGDDLVGIIHDPGRPSRRGLVIVVGGPQYRVGSHRSFVLLARFLATAGIPVFRFDYRGLGDSDGDFLGFEHLRDDIAAAIDAFLIAQQGLDQVVLWGLCDAASAALCYAPTDSRVTGVVLANPWVRSEATLARATLRHYYRDRVMQKAFWAKLLRGRLDPIAAARSFRDVVSRANSADRAPPDAVVSSSTLSPAASADPTPLPERMAEALRRYTGQVLLIMSGRDLTAREFDDVIASSQCWRRGMRTRQVVRIDLAGCDHTFSRRQWRDDVARATQGWLESW